MASHEAEVKVTSEAAEQFITTYYQSVNNGTPLESYYTSSSSRYATSPPDISINGLPSVTPKQYEAMLAEQSTPPASLESDATAANGHTNPRPQRSRVEYLIESFDCHVVNPNFSLGDPPPVSAPKGPGLSGAPVGQRASLLVQITGRLQLGRGKEAELHSFNEVFVLVPNWDALGRNAPRNARRWLIMSQNFRRL